MSAAGPESTPPPLQEIKGPAALGGGWRRFFDLLRLTSVTEFKLGFHGTALGFLWSLIRPLLLFSVLLVVFTHIFRFGDAVKDYPALLLFNVMLFGFFQESTSQAVTSVVRNESVVRKMQFPRLVIPLSVVATAAFQLALNLVVVIIFMLAYGVTPLWTWALLPLLLAGIVIITTATSMLVSALFVRFRDVSIIWSVAVTVLFYATPVLYPIEQISTTAPALHDAIAINPISPIFEQANEWMIDPDADGFIEAANGNPLLIAIPIVLFIVTVVLGVWVFRREAPRVAEAL
jgi:ABC-2 type transport system permease protein